MESEAQVEASHSESGETRKDSETEKWSLTGSKNFILSIFSTNEMPKSSHQSGKQRRKGLDPALGSKEDENRY